MHEPQVKKRSSVDSGGEDGHTSALRVLVADDTPAMVSFLEDLIGSQSDMELVAVARDTAAVIALAGLHQPDVILLDVRMPGGGGTVAAPAIRASLPKTWIVALSTRSEKSTIEGMMAAGADAYVVKGPDAFQILEAIRAVTTT